MKRGTKITLIVILIVLAVGIIAADALLSSIATRGANKALAAIPGGEASVGAIHLRLFSGTAAVDDVRYTHWGQAEGKTTELYLFGPCINGVVKTMLPGLFIRDKTKVLDL